MAKRITEGDVHCNEDNICGVHCCKDERRRSALPQGGQKVVCISVGMTGSGVHCCKDHRRQKGMLRE